MLSEHHLTLLHQKKKQNKKPQRVKIAAYQLFCYLQINTGPSTDECDSPSPCNRALEWLYPLLCIREPNLSQDVPHVLSFLYCI